MLYTKEDVMDFIEQEDVKFIRLAFCDVFGTQKNISVMASEIQRDSETEYRLTRRPISRDFPREESDLFRPPTVAARHFAWRPSHGIVRLFCNIQYPDAATSRLDSRLSLQKEISARRTTGIQPATQTPSWVFIFSTPTRTVSRQIYLTTGRPTWT